ncbi:MAG TPA: transcriptional repressor [Thermoanaerobaculia bacterium]|nr:transcriptional repressor [Thermoanaerobaculia bacterium]
MARDVVELLTAHGIQPSAHRVAVAQYVLTTRDHPSADRVWARVRERFPMISRATVYNTLNLFVQKELLRELHLAPDSVVFDPKMDRHHHLIDDETGTIYDIDWNQVEVRKVDSVANFQVSDYQVVMHGRKRRAKR